ncbi:MAG: ATPase, partial [Clostridia bacterium]|nr:ATPase [Clostridia bacterium]
MDWHNVTYTQTASELKTDITNGLSSAEAKKRLEHYGKNLLHSSGHQSVIVKFFSQFADFMVLILLAAAGVSFFTSLTGDGNFTEPVMILLIVILNAAVGTIQECRAEKAIDALKKLSSPHARVIRSGKQISIPSEELVPGDILCIEAGDLVCADARLADCTSLKAEESALTGESVPSDKRHDCILPKDAPPADRSNMIFSSSFITSGHAKAIVTETGMKTQVGKIAEMI